MFTTLISLIPIFCVRDKGDSAISDSAGYALAKQVLLHEGELAGEGVLEFNIRHNQAWSSDTPLPDLQVHTQTM